MSYQPNMSGWTAALRDRGLSGIVRAVGEDRLAEIAVLTESGLPTYDYHILALSEVLSQAGAAKVAALSDRYAHALVLRAASLGGRLQRYSSIGQDWREALESFRTRIPVADWPEYRVIVNEYDPARWCGAAVSQDECLTIEMIEAPNLETLCHGALIPFHGRFFASVSGGRRVMRFGACPPPEATRSTMWRVVKALSTRPEGEGLILDYRPRQGYFEFVISARTGRLLFIDCKPLLPVSPMLPAFGPPSRLGL